MNVIAHQGSLGLEQQQNQTMISHVCHSDSAFLSGIGWSVEQNKLQSGSDFMLTKSLAL